MKMNPSIQKPSNPSVPVKSLKKALDLLSMLMFDDLTRSGVPLTELARRMAIPVNTAYNLLKTMAACDYVAQTSAGAYCVGPRMVEAGHLNRLLSAVSTPELKRRLEHLCNTLGETVTLVAVVDGRRISLCMAHPHQAVGVNPGALEPRSLYAMSTGRVLAAYVAPSALERIIARNGLPGAAWNGISSRPALARALAAIRRAGHEVIAPDESDLVTFAVPVLDGEDHLVAALGCFAPRFRCDARRQAAVLKQLLQATPTFSGLL